MWRSKEQKWFKATLPSPWDMTEVGQKRFCDRRAAARVNNGTTSFREARRRWARVCPRAFTCVGACVWGAYWVRRGWGAQKQPSGQTSQHQSAPVTRARTIGANIAILPAFTFDEEKDNGRRDGYWATTTCMCPRSLESFAWKLEIHFAKSNYRDATVCLITHVRRAAAAKICAKRSL